MSFLRCSRPLTRVISPLVCPISGSRAVWSTGGWHHSRYLASSAAALPLPDDEGEELDTSPRGSSLSVTERIGFLGAGQMATAIIRSWLTAGVASPSQLAVSNQQPSSNEVFHNMGIARCYGAARVDGAKGIAADSEVIFLGTKPQVLDHVLETLRPHVVPERHLVVSIAAGIPLARLQSALPPGTPVIRMMPNTPLMVGQGAVAYCVGDHVRRDHVDVVLRLMSSSGLVLEVEEKMMDAVTAVSGSGPAFLMVLMEAMADGGVLMGLPREAAMKLVAQTVLGSAALVLHASGDGSVTHPAVLKDAVSSPAGTTIAGLHELEGAGVRGAMMKAVQAAARRSQELSGK